MTYDFKLWFDILKTHVTVISSESFIKPDLIPPPTRNDVTKILQENTHNTNCVLSESLKNITEGKRHCTELIKVNEMEQK